MHEFAAVLGNAVTGLFTLLGGVVLWRLKRKEEESDKKIARSLERRRELVELYAQVFSSLEQAMKCAIEQEMFELTPERTLINAKVRLLGSESVNLAYDDVADKLKTWSKLYVATLPQKAKIGEQTVVVLQAPDPTEKFKIPAQEAHKALHGSLQDLRKRMHADLCHV